ncbi:aspartic peptidase A1 [Mycena galericulata]|nr:aspartic peptidase A1 [Mycena galericulata]
MLALTLLPAILLALRVAAGPVLNEDSFISLPISRRFNFTGSATIAQQDLARVQAIKSRKSGTPGYGSGSSSGTEYTDTVTLAPGLVITQQSIGVASTSSGFTGVDGTLSDASATIPTITDNLFSQGTINSDLIGISFEPATSDNDGNGSIAFARSSPVPLGSVAFTPITSTSPASEYWGNDQSVAYGGTTILSSTAGIVDTGTTLILLATDAFNQYQQATGGVLDSTTGLTITSDQFAALSNLDFNTYTLTPNAQIWPRSLNSDIGGTAGNICLVVADIGSPSGSGLDFIDGYAFLERFYSVFDTGNQQVGFATTPFTTATTN